MSDKEVNLAFSIISVGTIGGLIATNHGSIAEYSPILMMIMGYWFGRTHEKAKIKDDNTDDSNKS